MRLIHSYHQFTTTDKNTIRREVMAAYSWRLAAQNGDIVDCPFGMRDAPRLFDDGDRKMVFFRDCLDFAVERCTYPGDVVIWTNADCSPTPDICARIEKVISSGKRGLYGARRDFQRIDFPLTAKQIEGGKDYCGRDLFVFTPDWWKEVHDEFPDMLIGAEAFDGVMQYTMIPDGFPDVPFLIAHEQHPSRWIQNSNRVTLASQRHNLLLASAAFKRLGVPWKERTYGAVPRWDTIPKEMPVIHTHNSWHIGDNLIHLNFLRKVARDNPHRKFIHACDPHYIPQLSEQVEDAKNITLIPLENKAANSLDSWKNAGGFLDRHPYRFRWAQVYIEWFDDLAAKMGVRNPCWRADDLLNDSPAILKPTPMSKPYDVLLLNGRPGSGQFKHWTPDYFDPLIKALQMAGRSVICTSPSRPGIPCTQNANLSVIGIGNISLKTPTIIGIPSAPFWPTLNTFNRNVVKNRIVLLDHEQGLTETLECADPIVQVKTREEAMVILRQRGVI